ncbi:hypothetical protein AKJ09_09614 [Labilithrix luteola]|uniref:Uncharacterized protein n=1 Tax=Labilithrix luteola TaxID=1391654 RepID=A0A0K1QAY6_9BACT|nr:hypothetical protein [Labilithrix luteola]AKV02951.1 hypothetical protein AKJ09_09614 [Labilithrix luteola]
MMKFQKPLAVLAVTAVTCAWTGVGRADDTDQTPSVPGPSPGINPTKPDTTDTVPPGTTPPSSQYPNGQYPMTPYTPTPSTTLPEITPQPTTTTSAEYEENVGAEKKPWIPNRPLLFTGGAMFLGAYGASVITAAISSTEADEKLYIPVVGPWLDMGTRECGFGQCGAREDVNNAFLVASGVVQGVGVGLAVASLFVPDSASHSRSLAKSAPPPKPEVHVTPTSMGRGAGVGAYGTF